MEKQITIRRPYDMHVHVRQGDMLRAVIPFTSDVCAGAVLMGNTVPPIATAFDVVQYRDTVRAAVSNDRFSPILSVMLLQDTTPKILEDAYHAGARVLKMIPGGTSTNSHGGIPLFYLRKYYDVLACASSLGMIFSGHWELVKAACSHAVIPESEREVAAINYLRNIIDRFPSLKIVVEHVSTAQMCAVVQEAPDNVAATLTTHHALLTENDVCDSDGHVVLPLHYCKPIAKRVADQQAIVAALLSNNPKFFWGSDSAPHLVEYKCSLTPAAGIFSAPVALPLLCDLFERADALDRFENFVSVYGPRFYGVPVSEESLTFRKESWVVPLVYEDIPIFYGGKTLAWKFG